MKTMIDDDDDGSWSCGECRTINPKENTRCDGCEKKKTEEDEIVEISERKIPSSIKDITENMNFRFPRRMVPY